MVDILELFDLWRGGVLVNGAVSVVAPQSDRHSNNMSESTTSTTRTTQIIGKGDQYEPWIHQTQATALEHEIWEYMDPEIEESERPVLTEPMPPTVLTVISIEEIIERRRVRALTTPSSPSRWR